MAQPVTPQDYIRAQAQRALDQQAAAKKLAADLAAQRAGVEPVHQVEPDATAVG